MSESTANRRLKIEAHDASRVEWSVYIPLPNGEEASEAEVQLRLEFPENAYVPHDGWEHLQILARLSSPDEEGRAEPPRTFDELRRGALAVARRLKLLRESMPRAAVAHALNPMPVAPSLARELDRILDDALAQVMRARATLLVAQPGEAVELTRERALADEFLSGQLLELLTAADETASRMLHAEGLPGYHSVGQELQRRVRDALAAELRAREQKGEMLPDRDDAEALAAFLDRAAQLKKHFQEVLFLEPETKMLDQAVRNWVGSGAAALAFVLYFGLQTLQTSAAAGLGLITITAIGAVAYALKDRAKELTRQWVAGKLSHFYANRLLVLREPLRAGAARQRHAVIRARESLLQDRWSRPDPLNPAAGATQRIVTVRYSQRARVMRLRSPEADAFERIKIVFRYDLSPILTRLDDSVKRVPVVSGEGVQFADAPRLYRVPMSVSVATALGVEKRDATIVLNRRGIARIQPEGDAVPAPLPPDAELPELDDPEELVPQT